MKKKNGLVEILQAIAFFKVHHSSFWYFHLFQRFGILCKTTGLDLGPEDKCSSELQFITMNQLFDNQVQAFQEYFIDHFRV